MKGNKKMETIQFEKVLDSQLRTEIFSLFSKPRSKKQIIFAFENLLNEGSINAAEFFLGWIERSINIDADIVESLRHKFLQYKKNN